MKNTSIQFEFNVSQFRPSTSIKSSSTIPGFTPLTCLQRVSSHLHFLTVVCVHLHLKLIVSITAVRKISLSQPSNSSVVFKEDDQFKLLDCNTGMTCRNL